MDPLVLQFKKDIAALCKPRGRLVGSVEHREAREYIIRRLQSIGIKPYKNGSYEFPYQYASESFVNAAGVIRLANSNQAPLLLGAHYDSVIAAPSADDNAAAVAITLGAAEMLCKQSIKRDIIFAFFDAEEPPYFTSEVMGSVRFYEDHLRHDGVEAALIMDLVGHDVLIPEKYLNGLGTWQWLTRFLSRQNGHDIAFPILRDMLFVTGAESHPNLQHFLENTTKPRRLRLLPTLNRYIGDMSDHGIFRINRVPYLFFSCGRWPYYHMPTDTPEKLNYSKMARICRYLAKLMVSMSDATFYNPSTIDAETLTVDYEIRAFKKACGPLFRVLLKYLGLDKLSSRQDIDYLVSLMLSMGL